MGVLVHLKPARTADPAFHFTPATSSAAAADLVRSSARRLEGLAGREFRREVDRLLEALNNADAIGFHDATLMLQAEARFGAFFAAAAGPVLCADLAWGDSEQAFAEWAARAHSNWARIAAEYAKLELAAIGPGSPLVPRLVAIALSCQGDAIKWRAIAGRAASDYALLHRIYHLAETAGIARAVTPIVRHGTVVRASPQSLYLRALLAEALCAGALSRQGMEIADAWLLSWCDALSLWETPPDGTGATSPHVDLARADGLEVGPARPGASLRHVAGIGSLRTRLRELRRAFQAGFAPTGAALAETLPLEQHIVALCRLDEILDYWLGAAPAREERKSLGAAVEVDCFVGIGEIAGRGPLATGRGLAKQGELPGSPALALESSPGRPGTRYDRNLDYGMSLERIGRRAHVRDRSANGLGLLVPRWDDGHPMLGELVGVRLEGEMLVGRVVRRYAEPGSDMLRIGLRLIARDPCRIALSSTSPAATRGARETTALFAPGRDPTGKDDAIILSTNAFQPDAEYALTLAGRTYTIRFDRDEGGGRGWICIHFVVTGGEPAAAA